MVKSVREAGTAIRKEMVKRQALTAEVNLKYAESLRRIIEEDYRLLSKPFEDVFKEGMERVLKGEDLGKVVAETLFTLLVTS